MPRDGMSYDGLLVYSKGGKNQICNKYLTRGDLNVTSKGM